jgi:hypothetical protein
MGPGQVGVDPQVALVAPEDGERQRRLPEHEATIFATATRR